MDKKKLAKGVMAALLLTASAANAASLMPATKQQPFWL